MNLFTVYKIHEHDDYQQYGINSSVDYAAP